METIDQLKSRYQRTELAYQETCDRCATLTEQLNRERALADELLKKLHEIAQQLAEASK